MLRNVHIFFFINSLVNGSQWRMQATAAPHQLIFIRKFHQIHFNPFGGDFIEKQILIKSKS